MAPVIPAWQPRSEAPIPASPARITYISWAADCSRSDQTARELGGRSHMVYAPRLGSRPSTLLIKYFLQWMRTLRILREDRPDVVFVMTPPVFAALPVVWYAWRHGKQVVLDAHTCAFTLRRWRLFQWLQRAVCRRADTPLVTNDHIAGLVRAKGGDATLVPDVPVVFPKDGNFTRSPTFMVAVVCSFANDEPLPAIFDAARQLANVQFYVTGDSKTLSATLRASLPPNVTLTGFLPRANYGQLITCADVVMDLTTADHTMLRGAYEAIYQGVPVIVSDWPLLRDAFPIGAVHVDNSTDAIIRAVRTVQSQRKGFRHDADRLRRLKLDRWRLTRRHILERIGVEIPQGESTVPSTIASEGAIVAPCDSRRTNTAPLTRMALERDGFASARQVFRATELDEIEAILDPMVLKRSIADVVGLRRDPSKDRVTRQPELSRPALLSPRLRRSGAYAKCRALATDILGSPAHYLFDHAIYKMPRSGTAIPWHQDLAYLGQFADEIQSLHFWIPLQDTPMDSGALRFVAGSHLWPLLRHVNANDHILEASAPPQASCIVNLPLRRGDLTVHTSRTLHASGPNNTDAVRKAWIIHFGNRSAAYKHWMKVRDLMSRVRRTGRWRTVH